MVFEIPLDISQADTDPHLSHPSSLQRLCTRAAAKGSDAQTEVVPVSDVARRALEAAANSTGQTGWFSFWLQLALSIVSAVILLFSVAFTSQVRIHLLQYQYLRLGEDARMPQTLYAQCLPSAVHM